MNKSTLKALFLEIGLALGLGLGIFFLLHSTVQHSVVDGSSMLPGLVDGQRLIVNKAAYLFKDPQRGDIVIIHPPIAPQTQWVKRVIGLPGDVVRVQNGRVYVNDIALDEPYIKDAPRYPMSSFTVPADSYFVLGDNRNNSTDSHYGWTVKRNEVIGEVWLRFWPIENWGIIHPFPLNAELQSN